jgi:D-aminopeptidase
MQIFKAEGFSSVLIISLAFNSLITVGIHAEAGQSGHSLSSLFIGDYLLNYKTITKRRLNSFA